MITALVECIVETNVIQEGNVAKKKCEKELIWVGEVCSKFTKKKNILITRF